jgi:hypothetical protein
MASLARLPIAQVRSAAAPRTWCWAPVYRVARAALEGAVVIGAGWAFLRWLGCI